MRDADPLHPSRPCRRAFKPDAACAHGLAVSLRRLLFGPVWSRILVLVAGTVLAPDKRTVSQALRVMGLETDPGFSRYHEVLNRARWDGRSAFFPTGEVVLGVDDTIERCGGSGSRRAGFTAIRCAPHAATSFGPAVCAGCRSWSWCRSLGPAGAGHGRS